MHTHQMEQPKKFFLFFFFNFCLVLISCSALDDNERKPYIVYMGALPQGGSTVSLSAVHHNILVDAIGDEGLAMRSKIQSYGKSFNALAAWLLPREAKILSEKEGIVSVFPSMDRKLQTSHSWDFLGMPINVKRNLKVESDIIVGVIDTGIWIDSPSFSDKGIGPPPSKWKGICQMGLNFTGCNNKVIGAQVFNLLNPNETSSPADYNGHGSHTASTAAGAIHDGANIYGVLNGTVRGGAPAARIAIYKACGESCADVDILAAFDTAIADGVDILSVSLGGPSISYVDNSVSIGAFHAMQKGILTSCAGGNGNIEVQNVAPWTMTVAASTTDRKLETLVETGDGETYSGVSLNLFNTSEFPLTSGSLASVSSFCDMAPPNRSAVIGKALYCQAAEMLQSLQDDIMGSIGAKGIIILDKSDIAFPYIIAGAAVNFNDSGTRFETYINTTKNATIIIHQTRSSVISKTKGPLPMASFSSRGPQSIAPNLLKPDISAPGLNIFAAFSPIASISGRDGDDKRTSAYNVLSGTSMACPHASAAAAYVKSFHLDWSPAAIKSALMTTAKHRALEDIGAELAYGSGLIDPVAALNPGLVYDLNESDYVSFLCSIGYGPNLGAITGNKTKDCSKLPNTNNGTDGLNYPTINIQFNGINNNSNIHGVFYRTVTNVGSAPATYNATIETPKGLFVKVSPEVLSFESVNEKKSFQVTLNGNYPDKDHTQILSGSLIWRDSQHNVRTPIVVSRITSRPT